LKLACRVAATMAGLHMRTWLHAVPVRHHAASASVETVSNRRGPSL